MCNMEIQKNSNIVSRYVKIPFIYVFSHLLIGYLGYYNKTFIVFFFVYQLYQYTINKRFYLLPYCLYGDKRGVNGNSIEHTTIKLLQGLIGYLVAYIIHNIV